MCSHRLWKKDTSSFMLIWVNIDYENSGPISCIKSWTLPFLILFLSLPLTSYQYCCLATTQHYSACACKYEHNDKFEENSNRVLVEAVNYDTLVGGPLIACSSWLISNINNNRCIFYLVTVILPQICLNSNNITNLDLWIILYCFVWYLWFLHQVLMLFCLQSTTWTLNVYVSNTQKEKPYTYHHRL